MAAGRLFCTMAILACLGLAACTPGSTGRPSGPGGVPAVVRIRVEVMGGGEPLENMQVELYRERFEPVPGPLVQSAVTNAEGVVELRVEAGTYGFWVRSLKMDAQWGYDGPTRYTFRGDQEIRVHMAPAY